MRKILNALVVLALLAVTNIVSSAEASPPHDTFIVVLEPGTANVPAVAAQLARGAGGQVGFVYEHAIQGFSITASENAARALERNPNVAYIERDREVSIAQTDSQVTPTGIDRIFAVDNDAIDIDGSDDFRVDVDVAVIDTGVDFEHPDLNVVGGVNCASGGPFGGGCVAGGDDDHYHGTHVAGTIGALDNGFGVVGVAPGARIHAVKVLSKRGSGYTSWIVAGIDWVTANAATIEVANMSLGGSGFSQAEYDAIQGAVEAGVAFAVAAGNDSDSASNYSPAAFDNVLTVSALADFDGAAGFNGAPTCRPDQDDTLADFSNYGPAVDIAAPGVCILSTYPLERGGYDTISGTSMASPHVAGALALLTSGGNRPTNAAEVFALYVQVVADGNTDWTDDSLDQVQERLLDVGGHVPTLIPGGGGGEPPNQAPTVEITGPGDGAVFDTGTTVTLVAAAGDPDGDAVTVSWSDEHGSIGEGETVTYSPVDGSHTIVATADDGNGGTATDSVTITVGEPPTSTLTGSSTNNRGTWTATVTFTGSGTVTGMWDDGTLGTCDVGGSSSCSFDHTVRKRVGSVTFTPLTGEPITILKP